MVKPTITMPMVYCKGQGKPKGCRNLVQLEGDRLCDDCRGRSNNCVVCGTGCHWWLNDEDCLNGHKARGVAYAGPIDLLREKLAYYEGQGKTTYDSAAIVKNIIEEIRKLAKDGSAN